jgi:nucleoside-diphosphate-sugar epimerase
LRPHLIWGPRDTHILPGLLERARAGRVIQVGPGTNRADLTYVEDAARAHLLAADALQPGAAAAGSVYFISQDDPVRVWPWINDLLVRLDIPPVRRSIPLWAARAASSVLELVHRALRLAGEPRLTRFLASELAMSHYYDISRARRDLGYLPQFTMEEGLARTVAYLTDTA